MPNSENPYHAPSLIEFDTNLSRSMPDLSTVSNTRLGIVLALIPGLVVLGLFYSLALHMVLSLGAFPKSIGERGFPTPLLIHAWLAQSAFAILLISCIIWPFIFLAFALVRRLHLMIKYLIAYGLSAIACFVVMSLAPAQFLYWWWD